MDPELLAPAVGLLGTFWVPKKGWSKKKLWLKFLLVNFFWSKKILEIFFGHFRVILGKKKIEQKKNYQKLFCY